ncbi:MAG: 2-oxoacid:acceptor oxidoreductase family protein [Deltaproteobacteria bacterium]|nr:2-oxoacid:acceptor oxidoreductase family protein [Deltaproteobacteria bacterium]
MLDIWGMCTGRYARKNSLNPRIINERLATLPPMEGIVEANIRKEYGAHYRELAGTQKPVPPPKKIRKSCDPPRLERQEILMLGNAGQRIISAGDLLCYAGLAAGMKATQKTEYDITVLTGPSISEVILSPEEIGFTGIEKPSVVIALGQEGVERRADVFDSLDDRTLLIQAKGVKVPANRADAHCVDFRGQRIKTQDWALASLAVLAGLKRTINVEMLQAAIKTKFGDPIQSSAIQLVDRLSTVMN